MPQNSSPNLVDAHAGCGGCASCPPPAKAAVTAGCGCGGGCSNCMPKQVSDATIFLANRSKGGIV